MAGFKPFLRTLVKSDSGVTALEYGLMLALISVVVVGAISGVGDKLDRNLDIVVAAVSDQPAEGHNPSAPSDGDGGTVSDPAGEPAVTPVADGSTAGSDGGGISTATTVDEQANRSSGGEIAGSGMGSGMGSGGANLATTAAASTADGSGSGAGSTGHSGAGGAGRSAGGGAGNAAAGSDGASDPGAGQDGEPGEKYPVFGRDSTRTASRRDTASWDGNTAPKEVAASVSAGEARSADRAPGGGGESALKSAIILLLWLCLGIGIIILGWKITLRAATKKDAKEQLENWEPASFGEKNIPQLG